MTLPNKWGQGQLFAFSALDGNSFASDDFVGTLSGDRIGIRFHSKTKRELAFAKTSSVNPSFDVVASDVIYVNTKDNKKMHIIYADTHLIVGNTDGVCDVVVFTDGICNELKEGNIEIQDTNDGEFTAILRDGNKFSFAFGKSKDEVVSLAKKGIALDIGTEKDKKLSIYKKLSLSDESKYAKLYAKFISVMKSQLYTPEGPFNRIYSTPDRLPHKKAWLWDSVFHAIGHKHIDMAVAENLLLTDFDVQNDNGFIPHMFDYASQSPITQPPVIAWGAYNLYKKSGNKEFLKKVFENNKKFLLWCQANRRDKGEELYTWLTGEDINCRCDESGMDNSPRFDTDSRLWAIDYSCFMANDTHYMSIIADELGDMENAEFFRNWYEKIKTDINKHLWCEEDKFYYDYDLNNNCMHKIQSVASFLPLFAGICDENQAKALYEHLTNPETFYTEFPVPSISKKDATFGSDMWRGSVWINYNYMIAEGLDSYGFENLAYELRVKTVDVINTWYMRTGTVYEFYDCENKIPPASFQRKGDAFEPYDFAVRAQSIRDYGWSNTLTFDLLNTYIK